VRICYALLSPTFGMHQYTADLAATLARAGHAVQLATTDRYPADRYDPAMPVICPSPAQDTGYSLDAARPGACAHIVRAIEALQPDVVHFTGPHIWNVAVMRGLARRGIPLVHTLHDLDPHAGGAYGRLVQQWNRAVLRWSDHILVHGKCYRQRLLRAGLAADRVSCTPLLHPFVGHASLAQAQRHADSPAYEPFLLFFGRIEPYKGLDHLLRAWRQVRPAGASLVVAGPGDLSRCWEGALPASVELRNHLVSDAEASGLFQRCAAVVLPYTQASQSALIAAAYYYQKPVIASHSGALPEYVETGETGWLVYPIDEGALADALAEALASPQRLRRMGTAGRRWYEQQRERELPSLQSMYAQVVGGASTASAPAASHIELG